MKKTILIKWGTTHALGVLVYVLLVSLFMSNGDKIFGQQDQDIVTPLAVLMLFVFSAFLTGALVLAKPVMLYLDGKKKEGVHLLIYTGLSLFVLTILSFLLLIVLR